MKVIHVARKPLVGSVAKNALKHGTGGINIDRSRVGSESRTYKGFGNKPGNEVGGEGSGILWLSKTPTTKNLRENASGDIEFDVNGRWPANLILEHRPRCQFRGTKQIKGNRVDTRPEGDGGRADKSNWRFRPTEATKRGYSGDDGQEVVADWDCAPDCPCVLLDEQSGILNSHGGGTSSTGFWARDGRRQPIPKGDSGGASRFFKQVRPFAIFFSGGDS